MRVDTAPEGEDIACENLSKYEQKTPPDALGGIQGKVALSAARGDTTRAEMSQQHDVHPNNDAAVCLHAYETVSTAREGIGRYINFYDGRGPHSSHQARTPDLMYYASLPQPSADAA